ncbi:MAG: lipoyl synthase [Alphaproteobacteria bacterium]|nr:lipoyl synthase [Alphaproteobacteria bacterium]
MLRKPEWIRVNPYSSKESAEVKKFMRSKGLCTVCEEAACPNMYECWKRKTATFMILGDVCTRQCAFCNVQKGIKPRSVDVEEPKDIAESVAAMDLSHVVITSVDRDDLKDGGSGQFIKCINEIRNKTPEATIEILTPDFKNKDGALDETIKARPDVFNHNMETIKRLYKTIRPIADYQYSLDVLKKAKELDEKSNDNTAERMFTKSGIMVGLGETNEEVLEVMDDLIAARVDFITIGQYLQPSLKHMEVQRYVTPEEFKEYEKAAYDKGFLMVSSTPLTRSSHNAGADFKKLRENAAK